MNPYVDREFNGDLNPMYATIYLGNNRSLDYNGNVHTWVDTVYRNEKWKVGGHVDLKTMMDIR